MPNDVVIKVENLSKLYRLGELHKQTGSFREKVTHSFSRMVRKARINTSNPTTNSSDSLNSLNPEPVDKIWALKDVSFDVKRGEIVGIIGRNGAGKTTLLKILSRITKPTRGTARINGRVGSLLEVGTGFHTELTGRENIYLNGAILGMKKVEIKRKFDEIVEFAEIEKFVDTPVKRYSSGMYVRLAFAVAAHLEPEILLVDEVLAVGDAGFQEKCLGKMRNVAAGGRTVLFVSHLMNAVQSLCSRVLLLNEGRIRSCGEPDRVVSKYLKESINSIGEVNLAEVKRRKSELKPVFQRIVFSDKFGNPRRSFPIGSDICLDIEVDISSPINNATIGIGFRSELGNLSVITGSFCSKSYLYLPQGKHILSGKITNLMLTPGPYSVIVDLRKDTRICVDRIEDAVNLIINPRDIWSGIWLPEDKQRVWICESSWNVQINKSPVNS